MDVENVFELVGVVCQNIAAVSVLGTLIEVVVLFHNLLQLALDVGNLGAGKFVLIQRHSSGLQSIAINAKYQVKDCCSLLSS